MEVTRLENVPPPPGIISSIRAGFDSIASHITAILLPLALNLFLWLGPRLRVNDFFASLKGDMIRAWQNGGIPATEIERVVTQYDALTPIINLFWLIRTLPIGISSLPLSRELSSTPLGDPITWQANGWVIFFGFFVLTFIGWLGGAIYFRSVAWVAVPSENENISVLNAILQTILISMFCTILFTILSPLFFGVLAILSGQNIIVTSLVVLVMSFISMWFIVPIFFLPHGVFVKKQNVFHAIGSSVHFTRYTLPNSSLFVLTIFLLAYGLNLLWSIPSETSWLMLLAIFGHSFVTTALLAASFIYYRDMSAWVQTVLEKIKPPVKQA
jgi:type IV secretory pathway VirB3-like protein